MIKRIHFMILQDQQIRKSRRIISSTSTLRARFCRKGGKEQRSTRSPILSKIGGLNIARMGTCCTQGRHGHMATFSILHLNQSINGRPPCQWKIGLLAFRFTNIILFYYLDNASFQDCLVCDSWILFVLKPGMSSSQGEKERSLIK